MIFFTLAKVLAFSHKGLSRSCFVFKYGTFLKREGIIKLTKSATMNIFRIFVLNHL